LRNLALGRATKQDVARQIGMHARTLDRKLVGEGRGFRSLLEEVRRDAAYRYLAESTLPITQIAAMIGFREPAVLTRSCRRWFGCAPRELRRAPGRLGSPSVATSPGADLLARVDTLERENARLRGVIEALTRRPSETAS